MSRVPPKWVCGGLIACAVAGSPVVLASPAAAAGPPDRRTVGDEKGVKFRVAFDDPDRLLGANGPAFRECVCAAAGLWAGHLSGKAAIDVRVVLAPEPGRAVGRCMEMALVKKVGRNRLFEPSAAAKLRAGAADTGGKHDIEVTVCGDYLADLWYDPAPRERTAAVPRDRVDTVSLFLHVFAHGLGMNGFLDPKTGELGGDVLSTYDRLVVHQQGEFYFVGLEAMKVHGGPVELSRGTSNYHHLGREGDRCPDDLKRDVMNGLDFQRGRRYTVSPLDLAILADCGLPVKRGGN